jgi:methionyl-tRNA formyltransferase
VHRIDTAIDAGNIVVQRAVEITKTDTALSLNLKCYIAARAAFDELLSELATESRVSYPQDLAQRNFSPELADRTRPASVSGRNQRTSCLLWFARSTSPTNISIRSPCLKFCWLVG